MTTGLGLVLIGHYPMWLVPLLKVLGRYDYYHRYIILC